MHEYLVYVRVSENYSIHKLHAETGKYLTGIAHILSEISKPDENLIEWRGSKQSKSICATVIRADYVWHKI